MKKQDKIEQLQYKLDAAYTFIEQTFGADTLKLLKDSLEQEPNPYTNVNTMEEYEASLYGQEW